LNNGIFSYRLPNHGGGGGVNNGDADNNQLNEVAKETVVSATVVAMLATTAWQ